MRLLNLRYFILEQWGNEEDSLVTSNECTNYIFNFESSGWCHTTSYDIGFFILLSTKKNYSEGGIVAHTDSSSFVTKETLGNHFKPYETNSLWCLLPNFEDLIEIFGKFLSHHQGAQHALAPPHCAPQLGT